MGSKISQLHDVLLLLASTSFLLFFLLSCQQYCNAQNSQKDYLNVHNVARGQVGVANITWDLTLATYAKNYAESRIGDCNLVHSGGPSGENLAKGSSSSFSGVSAVNLWVAEKPYYDYASNTCTGGKQCLHYTQVVWQNSLRLGCCLHQKLIGNTTLNKGKIIIGFIRANLIINDRLSCTVTQSPIDCHGLSHSPR
ncbi:Pathogenesis-related leaf protein 6 [Linum grandiflorum]